jgi:hypothetical protein
MPFRKLAMLLPSKSREESTGPLPSQEAPIPSAPQRRNLWRTGLLLATSAAFGGIAVAIWNRRTLAQMRQQSDAGQPRPE